MPLESKSHNNSPYYNTMGTPICPLHPNLEGKLDDIYKIVNGIRIDMAKEDGKEEAEEKHQAKEEKRKEKKEDRSFSLQHALILIIITNIVTYIFTHYFN
jgi:hypothetical protein